MKRVRVGSSPCRWWCFLLCVIGLMFVLPVVAWAHAHPEKRSPAAGAALQQAPGEASIVFTEELEPAFSSLKVTNAQGQSVDQGGSHVDKGEPRRLAVSVKTLEDGTYTVHWHVVARDGHTTEGEYQFQVDSTTKP